jgi:hypothetical protein
VAGCDWKKAGGTIVFVFCLAIEPDWLRWAL